MNKQCRYILYVFLAGFVCLLPSKAFSIGEIEFYVTNNTGTEKCFQCNGPFSRETPRVNVGANGGMTYFYTAEINSLSPFGHWSCFVYFTDNCFDPGPIPDQDTISSDLIIPAGAAVVDLTISEVQGMPVINVIFPGLGAANGDAIAVASNLGDDPLTGKEDRDTFRIKAEAGDQVTIRLDDDPSAGHLGSEARLRLRSGRRIGHFQKVESGELPLEITMTIPETGMYEVTIVQSDVPDNLLSYRGGCILSVSSAEDKIKSLIPGENVEN